MWTDHCLGTSWSENEQNLTVQVTLPRPQSENPEMARCADDGGAIHVSRRHHSPPLLKTPAAEPPSARWSCSVAALFAAARRACDDDARQACGRRVQTLSHLCREAGGDQAVPAAHLISEQSRREALTVAERTRSRVESRSSANAVDDRGRGRPIPRPLKCRLNGLPIRLGQWPNAEVTPTRYMIIVKRTGGSRVPCNIKTEDVLARWKGESPRPLKSNATGGAAAVEGKAAGPPSGRRSWRHGEGTAIGTVPTLADTASGLRIQSRMDVRAS